METYGTVAATTQSSVITRIESNALLCLNKVDSNVPLQLHAHVIMSFEFKCNLYALCMERHTLDGKNVKIIQQALIYTQILYFFHVYCIHFFCFIFFLQLHISQSYISVCSSKSTLFTQRIGVQYTCIFSVSLCIFLLLLYDCTLYLFFC